MTEEEKCEFLEGNLSEEEESQWVLRAERDSDWARDLQGQYTVDAELKALMGQQQENRDLKVVASVLKDLQSSVGMEAVENPVRRHWFSQWGFAAALVGMLFAGWGLGKGFHSTGVSKKSGALEFEGSTPSIMGRPGRGMVGPGLIAHRGYLAGLEKLTNSSDFIEALDAIDQTAGSVPKPERDRKIKWLVYRWVQVDPEAAVGFLKTRPDDKALLLALGAWSSVDFEAALAVAGTLGEGKKAENTLFAILAKESPGVFLEKARDVRGIAASSWETACRQLEEKGEMSVDLLKGLDEAARIGAMRGMALGKVATNAIDALNWAEGLEGPERDAANEIVLAAVATTDPRAAGQALLEMGGHRKAAETIVQRMALDDPRAALMWAREYNGGDDRVGLYYDVLKEVAISGNSNVFDLMNEMIALDGVDQFFTKTRDADMGGVVWWSKELDYERGIEWALSLPDDTFGKLNLATGMTNAWMKSHPDDPSKVAAFIDSITDDPKYLKGMKAGVLHQMSRMPEHYDLAWDFASQLPDEQGRSEELLKVFSKYAKGNHEEALGKLGEMTAGDRDKAIPLLAEQWASGAPEEAAVWAAELEDGAGKLAAYEKIAESWSRYDSYSASQWIAALPVGPARDVAITELVGNVAAIEAEPAWVWALEIGNPARRLEVAEKAATAWAATDLEGARRAIAESANLTRDEVAFLLQSLSGTSNP